MALPREFGDSITASSNLFDRHVARVVETAFQLSCSRSTIAPPKIMAPIAAIADWQRFIPVRRQAWRYHRRIHRPLPSHAIVTGKADAKSCGLQKVSAVHL